MSDGGESEDSDRLAILKRRQRFVSLALAGLASVALASCSATHEEPCLTCPLDGCGPPIPADGGHDAGAPPDAGAADSGSIVIRDAGPGDAGPADEAGSEDAG